MTGTGLLFVLSDPIPALEEEFNAWYDSEHLPERATLPGFRSAVRFVSLGDGPRYAAAYDLDAPSALDSEAYQAVSGANFSPWTRRVTGRTPTRRMVAELATGERTADGAVARLFVLRCRVGGEAAEAAMEAGARASFAAAPGLLRWRVLRGLEPAPDFTLVLAEFAGDCCPELRLEAFGAAAHRIDLAARYRPYV